MGVVGVASTKIWPSILDLQNKSSKIKIAVINHLHVNGSFVE